MSWDVTFEVGHKTLWLTCKAGYIDVAITAPNAEPEVSASPVDDMSVLLADPDQLRRFKSSVNEMVDAALRRYADAGS